MKPLKTSKFSRVAATCALAVTAFASVASAQNFLVGENNGVIQVITPGGTSNYDTLPGAGQVGGMIYDASGNLYVADTTGGNVYRYAPGGARSVFASGITSPSDVAIDNAGNVYVASSSTGTILRFGSTGGASTNYATGLAMPQGITFGPTGVLYVAEQGDGNSNTGFLSSIPAGGGARTTVASGLNGPVTLTLNATSSAVYVGLSGNTIQGFSTANGSAVNTYSTQSFTNPGDITIDGAGNLYALQSQSGTNSAIVQVAPDGTRTVYGTGTNNLYGFVATSIPEPTTLHLGALGLLGLLAVGWRRTRRTA